jgi:hypothetical protein
METVKRISLVLLTITFGVLLIFQFANAEIYKWVDDKGGIHFTEDPATIPEKYIDKVKTRATEEDSMTTEERVREKKKHEEEVREQLKKKGREYEANEFERRVKELEARAKKQREEGKCEIVSFSQFDRNLGGGHYTGGGEVRGIVFPGGMMKGEVEPGSYTGDRIDTCVDIVIQNNSSEAKTIQNRNIIAVSQKGKTATPKTGVFISIKPGSTYRGNICFGQRLSQIANMELQGL